MKKTALIAIAFFSFCYIINGATDMGNNGVEIVGAIKFVVSLFVFMISGLLLVEYDISTKEKSHDDCRHQRD